MKSWRRELSVRLRERVLQHYLVPDSRFGLPAGLVPHLPVGRPITAVDVGANRGHFLEAVVRHCGITRALLVEPLDQHMAGLRAMFPDPRVTIAQRALSDRDGAAELQVLEFDASSSLLTMNAAAARDPRFDFSVSQRVQVPVSTLDHLLAEQQWNEPIDLLNIDTQGTELKVLRGATRALTMVRFIWVEVSFRTLYEGDALFPEVYEFLRHSGFQLLSLDPGFTGADGELLQADALFRAASTRVEAPVVVA